MHPADCPKRWEYDDIPNVREMLAERAAQLLLDLKSKAVDTAASAVDTRPTHEMLFDGMAPKACPYYAGHYRGENYKCLLHCSVMIRSDPRVGSPPDSVLREMRDFSTAITTGLEQLDAAAARVVEGKGSRAGLLVRIVKFGAKAFEHFLRVHPYANGNGHAARFLICALLGRYDFWPKSWIIEPKPPDPPYTVAIVQYRSGITEPLRHSYCTVRDGDCLRCCASAACSAGIADQ